MRIYIPSMEDFFAWMSESGFRYAVLRSFLPLETEFYPIGDKRDIDMFVDDAAIPAIKKRYGRVTKYQGIKCDFYCAQPVDNGGYLDMAKFPLSLAQNILGRRRMWLDRFYAPSAEDHYFTLMYTIAYHKAEASNIDIDDPALSMKSKYIPELDMLEEELGIKTRRTLKDFHETLKARGYGVSFERLACNLQHDFTRKKHSSFLHSLLGEQKLKIAVAYLMRGASFDAHGQRILADKEIAALSRWKNMLMSRDYPANARSAERVVVLEAPDLIGQAQKLTGAEAVVALPLHFTRNEQAKILAH